MSRLCLMLWFPCFGGGNHHWLLTFGKRIWSSTLHPPFFFEQKKKVCPGSHEALLWGGLRAQKFFEGVCVHTFLLGCYANSLHNVCWCIGEKDTYGEAFVSVMRSPWIEHGCCVSHLFASGLCMWYKCTCEESHVVDAYLPHWSFEIMCDVRFAWCAGWCHIFGGEHLFILKSHESSGCAFCPSTFPLSSSAFYGVYAL